MNLYPIKNIARDISKHILHIEIKDDMEIIDKEFTRIEARESDLLFKNGDEIEKTSFYKIGMERGRKETALKNATIMIEKFNLSIDSIVTEFDIKKEELLEYMK